MANTYHQIYLQIVFAVKYRKALLQEEWRRNVMGVIGNLINESNCKALIVNGVEDHVHCLVGLKPVVSVSELMKAVKAKSSKYINDHNLTDHRFEWQACLPKGSSARRQDGYGVFSYSRSQIDNVYHYIKDQQAHHQKLSFREEYINLLEKFGISYDEQYIFKSPE